MVSMPVGCISAYQYTHQSSFANFRLPKIHCRSADPKKSEDLVSAIEQVWVPHISDNDRKLAIFIDHILYSHWMYDKTKFYLLLCATAKYVHIVSRNVNASRSDRHQGAYILGVGGHNPLKYVGWVRLCFDPLKCHTLSFKIVVLLYDSASFTSSTMKDLRQKRR